jgi:hypothetical protein
MPRCSSSARDALVRSDVDPASVMMVKRTEHGAVCPVAREICGWPLSLPYAHPPVAIRRDCAAGLCAYALDAQFVHGENGGTNSDGEVARTNAMSVNAHQDYLSTVRKEIAEKKGRLGAIDTEASVLRGELAELSQLEAIVAHRAGESPDPENVRPFPNPPVTLANRNGTEPPSHATVIEGVLRDAGRPMRMQEIIDAVNALHHPMPADPQSRYGALYSAMMRRPERFVRINKTWTLSNGSVRPPSPRPPVQGLTRQDVIEATIKDTGRPMTIPELMPSLRASGLGVEMGDSQFYEVLRGVLRRDGRFRKLKAGLWGLAPRDKPKERGSRYNHDINA